MEEMIASCMEMMNGMGGMMGGGMMQGGTMVSLWVLGWLLVIGVIAAIVLAAVWTARRLAVPAPQQTETPLTILRRRYAAGEIDAEQFQKMKTHLGES